MPNNGYISSSGINQVFTTGPYSGSIVTSSYSSGSILSGPTIGFYQSFISGTRDVIVPCTDPSGNYPIFQRWYYDPVSCSIGGCLPPTISSANVAFCYRADDYRYFLFFDSGSTSAIYSTIEYSTVSDFSFNTGSYAVTNSLNNYTSSINISNLPLLPLKTTPVYFRVFNSCSLGLSPYSNIVSASCQTIVPPTTSTFNVRLKNSMIGTNSTLYYTFNGSEYSLFSGAITTLAIPTLSSLTIPFRTLKPDGSVSTIICSGSSPTFNGSVTTQLNDSTPTFIGSPVYQSVNSYTSNVYYNSEGTPDASVVVDRTNWNGAGLLQLDFTDLVPSDGVNPWYYNFTVGGNIPGGGPKIICNLLYNQGYLPKEIWEADEKFGRLMLRTNKEGLFGYVTWAKPVVNFLTKYPQYTKYFYSFSKPWSEHMAYKMGVLPKDNKLGKVIHYIGNKFSILVYKLITSKRRKNKK
jgi:hypothetical protein